MNTNSTSGVGSSSGISADFRTASLDTVMMMVNMERANMLDGQVRSQAAGVQTKNAALAKANEMYAKLKDLQNAAGPEGVAQLPADLKQFCIDNGIEIPAPDPSSGKVKSPYTEAGLAADKAALQKLNELPLRDRTKPENKIKIDNLTASINAAESSRVPTDSYTKGGFDSIMNHMKSFIDNLTSTSQLEMTQLQSVMNKFNQTTEGLSNWLSKDSQSKNTITGNLR
ncbi:MAG: hypothetical protein ACAI35_00785 [Candidatus Methylacidiphilales bacterium]